MKEVSLKLYYIIYNYIIYNYIYDFSSFYTDSILLYLLVHSP